MSTRDVSPLMYRLTLRQAGFSTEDAKTAVDALAAAGLLRPDTTVDDREALALTILGAWVGEKVAAINRADGDLRWVTALKQADAVLASRPRGPVTETPAVTPAQVEAAEAALMNYARAVFGEHIPGSQAGGYVNAVLEALDLGIEVRGTDGLTDTERADLAQRYAEGPARLRTAEEIAAVRALALSWAERGDEAGDATDENEHGRQILALLDGPTAGLTTEQIEAGARAFYGRVYPTVRPPLTLPFPSWEERPERLREEYRDDARAVLSAALGIEVRAGGDR